MPQNSLPLTLLHQKLRLTKSGVIQLPGWQLVSDVTDLSRNEIDVWCIKASHPAPSFYISADEIDRADRFRFAKDRDQFVTGRGLLRQLLSAYLGITPDSVNFVLGQRGKPALGQIGQYPIHFNLSHSGGVILMAFTRYGKIGVDIELIHDVPNFDQVITRFFSDKEQHGFKSLKPKEKLPAFFTCWTRKEAFIKAKGDGLFLPLDQFDVSILPNEPASLQYTAWDPSEAGSWAMSDIPFYQGYCAALAIALP